MVSYIASCGNEYYRTKKRVFVDKRLPGMEHAQAGLLFEPCAEFLVSYETVVAECTSDGWIHVYAIPSRTTAKHLGKWGKQFGIGFSTLSELYGLQQELNRYTGKRRKAEYVPARQIGQKIE